jgi:putative ABC transport system ATP-binding protein
VIEFVNVFKAFGDKKLLNDFNLSIPDGEFVVFAGKSGCGKTTLLNMIGGLEKPDSGQLIVDGVDLYKQKNKTDYFTYKVGFLFQNFALIEDRTVEQNLNLVQKKARSGMELADVLITLGIQDKLKEKVYKLSGGEQQRVALARLMFKQCDIILADEPTGSLDNENAKMVIDILHKMNDMGKTIILVTHSEAIIQAEKNVIML